MGASGMDGDDKPVIPLKEWDRVLYLAAIILIVLLTSLFFVLATSAPPQNSIVSSVYEFVAAIITNVVPVLIIFTLSFALLRRIELVRVEQQRKELAENISTYTHRAVAQE